MDEKPEDMNNGPSVTISSDTLFHFTEDFDTVISILKEGFRPHYSLEDLGLYLTSIVSKENIFGRAFPMVCFCDIPLSQIRDHMKKYGHYGIGLSKAWGISKKVSPVIYTHRKSVITDIILQIRKDNQGDMGGTKVGNNDKNRTFLHVLSFIKAYNGLLHKGGDKWENVCFYNEREWRFVPPPTDNLDDFMITQERYSDPSFMDGQNRALGERMRLCFNPPDIKYIIVRHHVQVIQMIEKLEQIGRHYNSDDKRWISSTVIAAEQIEEDF